MSAIPSKARAMRLVAVAAVLALGGGALAAEPQAEPPGAAEREAPAEDRGRSFQLEGRLRAGPGGAVLEIGGAKIELLVSRGEAPEGESQGARDPRAQELRATVSLNDRTTSLVLRVTPPSGGEADPQRR